MSALIASKAEAEKNGHPRPSLVFLGHGGGPVRGFRKSMEKAIGKAKVTRDRAAPHSAGHDGRSERGPHSSTFHELRKPRRVAPNHK